MSSSPGTSLTYPPARSSKFAQVSWPRLSLAWPRRCRKWQTPPAETAEQRVTKAALSFDGQRPCRAQSQSHRRLLLDITDTRPAPSAAVWQEGRVLGPVQGLSGRGWCQSSALAPQKRASNATSCLNIQRTRDLPCTICPVIVRPREDLDQSDKSAP